MNRWLSWTRLVAVMRKEFIQMRRDRMSFALMVFVPVMQLVLFGYALNNDPRHLPTAIISGDATSVTRSLVAALQNSGYFKLTTPPASHAEASRLLELGRVQFVIDIPAGFTRQLMRGETPVLRVDVDAADPVAAGNAITTLLQLSQQVLKQERLAVPAASATVKPPFELRLHRRYNEEGVTAYNIVPGLMGVILTLTMVMMTALGVTRELERGTLENLLATPVLPHEVLMGKMAPYIIVGYIQVGVVLLGAEVLFQVPMAGSLGLLSFGVLAFIVANLTVGITFSSLARNMTQAMQMSFFFMLPSILLSGFMFPYRGMPEWAQWLGEVLPLTHFLRLVRGIVLKGSGAADVWPHVWPLLVFTGVVLALGVKRYRRTLD
ncbi:MAG: ABC transporter permease [Nevskiales bacterium]|nr:ABC transporter permease [Nevskiales bacterium]